MIRKRGRERSEYIARGAFVGLLLGLTPTVGIQIPIIALLWVAARKLARRLEFSFIAASAWTFVTNPLTILPAYYLFVATGRVLLGRWDHLRGFEVFRQRLGAAIPPDAGWLEGALAWIRFSLDEFGLPLLVGSIPWALLSALVGYVWVLRVSEARRAARNLRRRKAQRA